MTNSRNEANFSQISNLISSHTWQSTWIYNESSDCCAVFSGYNRGNRGNHFYIISCLSFQMTNFILDKRKLYSYTCIMFKLCKFELKYQNHKLAVNEINILDIITFFWVLSDPVDCDHLHDRRWMWFWGVLLPPWGAIDSEQTTVDRQPFYVKPW